MVKVTIEADLPADIAEEWEPVAYREIVPTDTHFLSNAPCSVQHVEPRQIGLRRLILKRRVPETIVLKYVDKRKPNKGEVCLKQDGALQTCTVPELWDSPIDVYQIVEGGNDEG